MALIAIFLVVQLAIPISRLSPPETAHRWAWQMFSRTPHSIQFVIHTPTDTTDVELHEYMAQVRGDIDLTEVLPPHLCAVSEDAVKVTWDSGELEC